MAPLPDNNTARLWVRKTGVTGTHETLFRSDDSISQADLIDAAAEVLNATKGLVYDDDTWVDARYAEAGSNVSFPVPWTPIQGTNGSTANGFNTPYFVDFLGRSTDGRRVRWSIQGAVAFTDNNYRAVVGENAAVDAGIAALNANNGLISTISGQPPIIYNYADVGFNAYQQRKQRRS